MYRQNSERLYSPCLTWIILCAHSDSPHPPLDTVYGGGEPVESAVDVGPLVKVRVTVTGCSSGYGRSGMKRLRS